MPSSGKQLSGFVQRRCASMKEPHFPDYDPAVLLAWQGRVVVQSLGLGLGSYRPLILSFSFGTSQVEDP